jgi:hypothetical protein
MAVEERARLLSAMDILGYLSKGVAESAEPAPDTYLEREASYANPHGSSEAPHNQEGGQFHKTGEGEMGLPSL